MGRTTIRQARSQAYLNQHLSNYGTPQWNRPDPSGFENPGDLVEYIHVTAQLMIDAAAAARSSGLDLIVPQIERALPGGAGGTLIGAPQNFDGGSTWGGGFFYSEVEIEPSRVAYDPDSNTRVRTVRSRNLSSEMKYGTTISYQAIEFEVQIGDKTTKVKFRNKENKVQLPADARLDQSYRQMLDTKGLGSRSRSEIA